MLSKAAILLLDSGSRRKAGWVLAALLSPLILLAAVFCSLGAGGTSHNVSMVELCFNGGTLPVEMPEEYWTCVEEMRSGLALLDRYVAEVNREAE